MSDPNKLGAKLANISRQLGLVTALVGGISLIWRALGLPQGDAFLPNFGTACAVVLCGSALSFPQHDGLSHAYSRICQSLAWVAFTLAVGSFGFYLFWGLPQAASQQRWLIAPMASFVVFVVASAILYQQRPRTGALAQGLAILGIMSCLLALIGFMLGTMAPAGLGTTFPMTSPAALLLLLLSLGVLWARPEVEPMAIIISATTAGAIARQLLLPLLVLPMLLNYLFHQMTRLEGYDLALEQALFTFVTMISIAVLVWWQVWTLHRLGSRQQQFEEQVRQEQQHAAEQLLYAAQHDPLTDLPNRTLTFAFGERLLEEALRHGDQCAVLFIDLDRFKPINDTFGHAAGDAVLCAIAQRLQRCVRGEDVVGRIGGDEFLVILQHVQKIADLTHVATNCLVAVERPIAYQNLELQVSSSIGISLYPTDGATMETLVKHADIAMYHAKQYGRHNFQFFTPAMNAQAKSLLKLEGRLRRAIEQQAFCLHYQPVVDTQTHRLIGAEALLRWPSQTIGPDEFIPLAESSGLILPLGDWVFQEVCQQQRRWVEQSLPPLRISVNVSPLQFRQPQFCERLARTLADSDIDPSCLQLEITENAVLQDLDAVVRTLHTLRDMGLRIALDDFGKGYSSLSYLKTLPLDTVKVDKDFVSELQTDPVNLAITEAIIHLGDRLGLQVVAEGIETEAVLQLLRTKHCHYMQGFYLSHPLPEAEFVDWCRDPLAPGRAYQH